MIRARPAPLHRPALARLRGTAFLLMPWIMLGCAVAILGPVAPAGDAASYYIAPRDAYDHTLGEVGYGYSPAFTQLITPLQMLPFDVFRSVVMAAEMWGLAYLVTPWVALGVLILQVWPFWEDIWSIGNLQLFTAAMLVVALRYPVGWPALLLMKVTPGIGIIWPAMRHEWRNLAIGLGLTAAIALISVLTVPEQWVAWIGWMTTQVDAADYRPMLPLAVRGILAVGLIAYAARTDRIWLVPIAAAIVSPEGGGHWLLAIGAWQLYIRSGQQRRTLGQDRGADRVLVGRVGDRVEPRIGDPIPTR